MTTIRSQIERRRVQITDPLEHLRRQFSLKTRKNFTTDFRFQNWIERSRDLVALLECELSILEEPSEYNELPMAVIADELGMRLEGVARLIKLSEIEATGASPHYRV